MIAPRIKMEICRRWRHFGVIKSPNLYHIHDITTKYWQGLSKEKPFLTVNVCNWCSLDAIGTLAGSRFCIYMRHDIAFIIWVWNKKKNCYRLSNLIKHGGGSGHQKVLRKIMRPSSSIFNNGTKISKSTWNALMSPIKSTDLNPIVHL